MLNKEDKYTHICLHGHKNIFGWVHKKLVMVADFKKELKMLGDRRWGKQKVTFTVSSLLESGIM